MSAPAGSMRPASTSRCILLHPHALILINFEWSGPGKGLQGQAPEVREAGATRSSHPQCRGGVRPPTGV